MTERPCRGGRLCRPSIILLLIASATTVFAQAVSQTADFIVVENPNHLVAYDAFQRSLTNAQRDALEPFMPMRILEPDDMLSDGLTRCTKVEANGNILYLLKDESGAPADRKRLGMIKMYRGKKVFQDTISILASDKATFLSATGSRSLLMAGERCVRYFDDAGALYVRRLAKRPVYGWIRASGPERAQWRLSTRPEPARSAFSTALRGRIDERVRQANQSLVQIYALLNKETGKRIFPPQWHISPLGESLRIVLLPDSALGDYPKSIEALSASLQTYVLGTGFDVLGSGNAIDIKPR